MESFSYQNGGQNREQDFQKLSQTIGTSIQKISQNGNNERFYFVINIILMPCAPYSFLNAANG